MAKVPQKIEKLLRTNTALFLLCVISVGVLILLWRGSGEANNSADQSSVMTVKVTATDGEQVGTIAGGGKYEEDDGAPMLAPEFRGMPAPDTFKSFVYDGEPSISISIKCNDMYSVVMIFSAEVDYRSSISSARYNSAEACIKGPPYNDRISIDSFGLQKGQIYYIVRASQGKRGVWHDPY